MNGFGDANSGGGTMTVKVMGAGVLCFVLLGCADVSSVPGAPAGGGSVVIEEGGAAYSVALADISSACSDPALSALDCTQTMVRSKVTREGTAFAGTEDERAAARVATQRACESRGLEPGRFSLTAGDYQSGIWVFDNACI